MAKVLGELSRQGKDGVRNTLVIGVGVRQPPPSQKGSIHIFPNAIGVDERPIHIK